MEGVRVTRTETERMVNFSLEMDVDLAERDIWPDGDAPENWTLADVATVVAECGGKFGVLRDWDLDGALRLNIYDYTSGESQECP